MAKSFPSKTWLLVLLNMGTLYSSSGSAFADSAKNVGDYVAKGWLISAGVAAFLLYVIVPWDGVKTILDRGRQWSGWCISAATLGTLYHFPYPPPKGGGEAIAVWLATSIPIGLVAFMLGAAFQAVVVGAKKIRKDGPEILGTAIKTTTDVAHRVQAAVKEKVTVVQDAQIRCPNCQTIAWSPRASFCQTCGTKFLKLHCSGCGQKLKEGQLFCDHCGLSIKQN